MGRTANALWDRLGISASLICVLHCLLTPVLLVVSPFLGQALSNPFFHLFVFVTVIPLAVWALWSGFKIHRNKRVIWLGIPGILLLNFAFLRIVFFGHIFGHAEADHTPLESGVMIISGLLLIAAHLANLKYCSCASKA